MQKKHPDSAVSDRPLYPIHPNCPILLAMTEITSRLSTALADRYAIERELGTGGMATEYLAESFLTRSSGSS